MNLSRLRPLGQIETAMAGLHEQAGTTQTSSLLRLGGVLNAALLRAAAALLWQRHPLLQASIQEDGERLYYARNAHLDDLPIRSLTLSDVGDALAQLEQELNRPLDPSRGLWKLALLSEPGQHQHHLILTCHHAIVDALSLTLLLGELLQFCQALLHGSATPPDPSTLAPALEHFLGAPGPAPMTSNLPAPTYQQRAPLEQRRTRVQVLSLATPQLQRLQRDARAAGLSLNALLGAALLQACEAIGLGQQIRLNSAVSLRQRAAQPIANDQLGCYIGVVGCDLQVSDRSLLALAQDYQQQLQQALQQADRANPGASLTQVRQRCAQLIQAEVFVQGVALTNHGRIALPETPAFVLHDYLNVACRSAGNFAVAVHATTFAERLNLSFTYVTPLIDSARIVALSEHLQHCLLTFGARQEELCHAH